MLYNCETLASICFSLFSPRRMCLTESLDQHNRSPPLLPIPPSRDPIPLITFRIRLLLLPPLPSLSTSSRHQTANTNGHNCMYSTDEGEMMFADLLYCAAKSGTLHVYDSTATCRELQIVFYLEKKVMKLRSIHHGESVVYTTYIVGKQF